MPGSRPNWRGDPAGDAKVVAAFSWVRRPWREGWPTGVAALGASTALGGLPLELALPVALAASALVVGLLHPVWPLALVALAVPFGSEVPLRIGGAGGATDLAVAIAVGVWGVGFLARRRAQLRVPAAFLPIVPFLGVLALSLTLAPAVTPGAKELLKWLEFGLVALAAAHTLGSPRSRRVLVAAVLVAASLEAAVGWYQVAARSGPESFRLAGGFLRAYGTFGQPNPFAGYLALALPLVVSLALGPPGRWRPPPLPVALGLALAGVLIGGGIALSLSRGAWLATLAALTVVCALHSRWARLALALGVGLLLMVGMAGAADALPPQVVSRFAIVTRYLSVFDARQAVVTPENYAIVERMAIWQAAAAMVADAPLLGVGSGTFDLAYRTYALRGWPTPPGHAHNAYLTVLAETGIVGALAHGLVLLGLFLLLGTALRRFKREGAPSDGYPLALGVLGMLVALSVHNLLDNLYVHGIPAYLGLMVGAVTAALPAARQSGQSSP
ncbi:MAG: O-antigen ligase family protein [Chloroflexi bacterium]|nr:O-antigen ligase family protein [Chloroflexota bacterium]